MMSSLRRGRATLLPRSRVENAGGRPPFATARTALLRGCASPLSAEFDGLGQPQIHSDRTRAASAIARQDLLTRRRVGIQQAVASSDQSWLVRISWDAGPPVE